MSSIERISVEGIRSFAPNSPQGMVFLKPLTLIVGRNGSGKTTLIECLHYVTTGDLPPGGTRNASFVHNPQEGNIQEMKSKVSLTFTNISGVQASCARHMLTSISKGKRTTRSMDNAIERIDKQGDARSSTTTCVNLTEEMIHSLGVSKAVMDNVIFCHQEEANWPLGEPRMLKQRFDEIFSATKYRKAQDALRKTRQEKDVKLRLCKSDLAHMQSNKDRAEKLASLLKIDETSLRTYEATLSRTEEELEPINEKLKQYLTHQSKINSLKGTIESKTGQKLAIEKNVVQLRSNIKTFFDGDLSSCTKAIAAFKQKNSEIEGVISSKDRSLKELESEESEMSIKRNELLKARGKLEAELQDHERSKADRVKHVQDYASKFGLTDYSQSQITDVIAAEFITDLTELTDSAALTFTESKKKHDETLQETASKILSTSNAKAVNEKSLSSMQDTAKSKKKLMENINSQLSNIARSHSKLQNIEAKKKLSEQQLADLISKFSDTAISDEIENLQNQKSIQDKKIRVLKDELKNAQHESESRTKLDMNRKNRAEKQEKLKRLLNKHAVALREMFPEVDVEELRDSVEDFLRETTKQINDLRRESTNLNGTLKSKEQDRDNLMDQLRQLDGELSGIEQKISAASIGRNLDEELENVSTKLQELQLEKGKVDGAEYMFKDYIKLLDQNDCCPLCDRNFEKKADVKQLLKKIEREIKQLPDQIVIVRQKLEETEKRKSELLQIKPVSERKDLLKRSLIPPKQEKMEKLSAEIPELSAKLAETNNKLTALLEREQRAKVIQSDAGQMDSLNTEISNLDSTISECEAKIEGGINSRSVNEIQNELDLEEDKQGVLNEDINSKQTKLNDFRQNTQQLNKTINELTKQILEINSTNQERLSLEDKRNTLEKELLECNEKIEEFSLKLPTLEQELADLRRRERKQKDEKEEMEQKHRRTMEDFSLAKQTLSRITEKIEKFNASGKTEQLRDSNGLFEKVDLAMKELLERRRRLLAEKQALCDEQSKSELKLRELIDSQTVKKYDLEIDQLTTIIEDYKKELKELDVVSNEKEYDDLQKKREKLMKELHEIKGTKGVVMKNVAERRKELESKDLKDAEQNYVKKYLEIWSYEKSIKDLRLFNMALDHAITEYHKSKMENINFILRDLWQKIYKNGDIDFIQIKSEMESETSTDKRRVYNYRVVMRRGGLESDMRGQCSAGQKVLASILIRIALAEVFCVNCGILALDEPTTNLDSVNIKSLAYALVELIEQRSLQRNFQLILITHDENFVRILLRGYPVPFYYGISKDSYGYSRIEKRQTEDLE